MKIYKLCRLGSSDCIFHQLTVSHLPQEVRARLRLVNAGGGTLQLKLLDPVEDVADADGARVDPWRELRRALPVHLGTLMFKNHQLPVDECLELRYGSWGARFPLTEGVKRIQLSGLLVLRARLPTSQPLFLTLNLSWSLAALCSLFMNQFTDSMSSEGKVWSAGGIKTGAGKGSGGGYALDDILCQKSSNVVQGCPASSNSSHGSYSMSLLKLLHSIFLVANDFFISWSLICIGENDAWAEAACGLGRY